jgi:hypothetical protein
MKKHTLIAILILTINASAAFTKSNETIWIFSEDLKSSIRIVKWTNIQGYFEYAYRKGWQSSEVMYTRPEGRWDRERPLMDFLVFEELTGELIVVERRPMEEWNLRRAGNQYHFTNWPGVTPPDSKRWGIGAWTRPGDFEELIQVFAIPSNFKIISFQASKPGNWKQNENTLTYKGTDVNDVVFDIKFQSELDDQSEAPITPE